MLDAVHVRRETHSSTCMTATLWQDSPRVWVQLRRPKHHKAGSICVLANSSSSSVLSATFFSHGAGLHHRLCLAPLVRGYSLDVDLDRHGVISELFLLDNSYTWKRSWKQCAMPLCACEIHIPLIMIPLWNGQSVNRAFFFSSVLVERQGMWVRRKCVDRMYDYVKFRCFPLLEESESRPRKPLRFAL